MSALFQNWHAILWERLKKLNTTEDWRSWRLKWWWISVIVTFEIGCIVTVAVLAYVSHEHNGFVTVQTTPLTTSSESAWEKVVRPKLWWTLLPAIVFSLLSIGYSTIVAATAERQPYVELHAARNHASNARNTILLDYPSYALFYAWAVAFRNAHIRLCCSMLVQLFVSIFLVSLAANLFRAEVVSHPSKVTLQSLLQFDISMLDGRKDLLAAMDVASAIHEYGAAPPGWMNEHTAVEPFSAVKESRDGNISTITSVYSAELDCRAIAREDIDMTFEGSDVFSTGNELISFHDRGCDVGNQGFSVSSDYLNYALGWYQQCNLTFNQWNDRIGVFLGTYSADDPQKMANFITVSCIPSYQNSSALVSLNSVSGQVISIASADADSIHDMRQNNFVKLHSNIVSTQLTDFTFASDYFGRKVFRYAQQLSKNQTIGAAQAINATQELYRTFFAALAQRQLFDTRVKPNNMTGKIFLAETRLKVVLPIAYILNGLLALMLACTIALFMLAYTSISVLEEEPVGLLGRAALLMQSDIFPFISNLLMERPGKRVVETVKSSYSVEKLRCFMDGKRIIRISELAEEPFRTQRQTKFIRRFLASIRLRKDVIVSDGKVQNSKHDRASHTALSVVTEEDHRTAPRRDMHEVGRQHPEATSEPEPVGETDA